MLHIIRNLITSGILMFALTRCADSAEKNKQSLMRIAGELNQKCPQMIDSETRFDGIDLKEPNTLVYKYTLVNINAKQVDTIQFYKALWPGIISTIKVSAEMKKLRENNTRIEYYYQDKNNQPIYTFKIGSEDYKNTNHDESVGN